MVFVPAHDLPPEQHEPDATPRRPDKVAPPEHPDALHTRWRAIVHLEGDQVLTAWHVAACGSTNNRAAHCPEGRRLLESGGDPDGHCLIDGRCARCD